MNRILLAMLLSAAPAFAREHGQYRQDTGDWNDSGDQEDFGSSWDDSWQSGDGSWQSDDSYADRGPTFDDFRNDSELSWNGEWIHTPEYGTVWRPRRVSGDWQPYVYGRWVWTQAGWAWASDEPFGWAVYHYGRWGWSPAFGWMWVPGRNWAPAWVTWRWSDGPPGNSWSRCGIMSCRARSGRRCPCPLVRGPAPVRPSGSSSGRPGARCVPWRSMTAPPRLRRGRSAAR